MLRASGLQQRKASLAALGLLLVLLWHIAPRHIQVMHRRPRLVFVPRPWSSARAPNTKRRDGYHTRITTAEDAKRLSGESLWPLRFEQELCASEMLPDGKGMEQNPACLSLLGDSVFSPKPPRPFQRDAVEFFFQHATATGNSSRGRPLRMQMVCGSGKTFIYALIIKQDLLEYPHGQSVVFVPWRDLARQTAMEFQGFSLKTCVLGDDNIQIDDSAEVIVCVYPSAHYLKGKHFRIKIVDEAHHLQTRQPSQDRMCWKTSMHDLIEADLEGDFSATFADSDVDYVYSFEQAVQDVYVCDLKVDICAMAGGEVSRFETLAQLVKEHEADWAPMLVLFNGKRKCEHFASKLRDLGVSACFVSGDMEKEQQRLCRHGLETGELSALCCVKLFNEGTSIPGLRTVVLAEPRKSMINLKQVAMRALRTHPSKPDNVGRFVQAVGIDHWISSDADLRKFVTELASMKVLAELKSYPAESQRPGFGRGRLSTWFRHLGEPGGEFQNREVTCGELDSLVNLRVFDRSGYCIDTRDDPCWLLKLRLKELRQWQESRGGGWPQTDSEDQDERQLAKWFKTLAKRAAKGNISTEERGLLQGTGLKLKPSET